LIHSFIRDATLDGHPATARDFDDDDVVDDDVDARDGCRDDISFDDDDDDDDAGERIRARGDEHARVVVEAVRATRARDDAGGDARGDDVDDGERRRRGE